MPTTRPMLGKYLCGMVASLIAGVAGGWLILAPFALGYQPYGADWVRQTTNDVVTGIPVVAVALVSFVVFFISLLASLRTVGVLGVRPRPDVQAHAAFQPQTPVSLATSQSDLDRTLTTLAEALAADLSARHREGSDQVSGQSIEQQVTRRES
jgi:hypothetical protein